MASANGIVSIPPSGRWEGGIGRWSTFEIQIGTPRQSVRLLPGTSATAADSIWPIIPQGCDQVYPKLADCANKRGGLFRSNTSSTWSTQKLENGGLYELNLVEESKLNLTWNNAYYGFDTVQIATNASTITLTNQLVAGVATSNFFLGSLGLSPIPFNFTNFNSPVQGFLGSLLDAHYVNSTTWAYTAGKPYLDPPTLGSLTFGGYDTARADIDRSIEINFNDDVSRDLVVGLQSITYDSLGSAPLMAQGVSMFLNSLVPDMWLPLSVCQQFEQVFHLIWDDTLQLYYVTESTHAGLVAQNPTFTFTIGKTLSGGNTTSISFPYAAFDMNATTPDISQSLNTSRYFPLKRAANSTQYTLGRVFFQEAYVIANYDTLTFTVRQALDNGNVTDLKAIVGPTDYDPYASSGSSALGTNVVVGMIIAFIVLVFAFGMATWIFCRKRRRKRRRLREQDETEKAVEMGPDDKKEMPAADVSKHAKFAAELDQHDYAVHELKTEDAELGGEGLGHELATVETPAELTTGINRHELPAGQRPVELSTGLQRVEMAANEKVSESDRLWNGRYELP